MYVGILERVLKVSEERGRCTFKTKEVKVRPDVSSGWEEIAGGLCVGTQKMYQLTWAGGGGARVTRLGMTRENKWGRRRLHAIHGLRLKVYQRDIAWWEKTKFEKEK